MTERWATSTSEQRGAHVAIVGTGNIGSHFVPHAARLKGVDRITLIEPDTYEQSNQWSQDIQARDVGKAKVDVQARRLRSINPDLKVMALAARFEDVPLGALACDVLVSCVDSRAARMAINEAAWRLGIPWVDAAVDAAGMLVRANVHAPGADEAACLECAWSAADYDAVEQVFACQPGAVAPAATNAPSSLGGLAAALEAIECEKILTGDWKHALVGRQVLIELRHHKHYVSRFSRNPNCRFDHQVWKIGRLDQRPAELTLGEVFEIGKPLGEPLAFNAAAGSIARRVHCAPCQRTVARLRLSRQLRRAPPMCSRCHAPMAAAGFDQVDWLDSASVSARQQRQSLRSLGLLAGDVVGLRGPADTAYYQLGAFDERCLGPRRRARREVNYVQ